MYYIQFYSTDNIHKRYIYLFFDRNFRERAF